MTAPGFDILAHISWDQNCSDVIQKKFKGKAKQWISKNLKDVRANLRIALLAAQNNRCAYCRRIIHAEIGKHEIDHIAPCSTYPEFTYTRINLIAACKRCNWHKREYDTLTKNSGVRRVIYTTAESAWNWVHPYIHSYSEHITILDGMIFTPKFGIGGRKLMRARSTIKYCGLSSIKTVCDLAMIEIANADIDDWTAALRFIGTYPDVSAKILAKNLKKERALPSSIEDIQNVILDMRGPGDLKNSFARKVLSK